MNNTDESSEYIFDDINKILPDFTPKMSNDFSNIQKIYSSATNSTEVYLASRYGKRYVLKAICESMRGNPVAEMALQKEFDIGINLDHPLIRRTIGFEKNESLGNIIIFDYFDGVTLDSYMATNSFDSQSARVILKKIASALAYLHSRQIVHRDLKPTNILVSHDGQNVSIIDFNFSDSDSYTYLKNPGGTKKYMAPEQSRPADKPSVAADIFSFGRIIGEMADVANDSKLKDIANRCCNPVPEKRPQSVASIKLPSPQGTVARMFSQLLYSKNLLYILAAICIALTVLIISTIVSIQTYS